MTQNEKDLLLKDICARLPYGVICQCDEIKVEGVLREIAINYNMCMLYDSFTSEFENCYIFDCKPYLFPLSSMTEEQKVEFENIRLSMNIFFKENANGDNGYEKHFYTVIELQKRQIDWLNKNHFDYRGLIPVGLANDATGLNIY